MAGMQGRSGGRRANAGRKPGVPNRLTTTLKTAILTAFDEVGGKDYLVGIAKSDPRTFCTLLGKVLPDQVEDDPLINRINKVEIRFVDRKDVQPIDADKPKLLDQAVPQIAPPPRRII